MIPDATRAGRLCVGGDEAFDRVAIRYGRRRKPFPNNFSYVFGNPTVLPAGPRHANCRSAGVAVLALGLLEAWIVVPVLTPTSLPPLDGLPDIANVVVHNGEHDWPACCNGATGHAEVVQLHFDPNVISYRDLLNVFFAIHDPTTLNRQGADAGTQYRSAIFYHDEEQKKVAEGLVKELNAQQIWDRPIVTQVEKLDTFYVAEDYHQEYFARNPFQPYCMAVVAPKVSKFRKHFLELLKKQPV
jgi:peptide-methionine (S)-S-oxide reductase